MNRKFTTEDFRNARVSDSNMQTDRGPIIYVEGPDDVRMFQPLFHTFVRSVGKNQGKDGVINNILKLTTPQRRDLCRGIIDRDYDFIFGSQRSESSIIYLDAHSVETFAWMTDDKTMLEKILIELVTVNNTYLCKEYSQKIYKTTYEIAYFIGLIRIANRMNRWGIKFDVMIDDMFFDNNGLFDERKYIEQLLAGRYDKAFMYDVIDAIDELKDRGYSKWHIMQGHDLTNIFVYFIDRYFNELLWKEEYKYSHNKTEYFGMRTRQVSCAENIKKTNLYKEISAWENRN